MEEKNTVGVPLNFKWDEGEENSTTEEIQDKRAELRETFLWAVTGLTGQKCKVAMTDNLKVTGTLRGIDKDGLLVHMQALETPSGTHEWSVLRLPDCTSLHFQQK